MKKNKRISLVAISILSISFLYAGGDIVPTTYNSISTGCYGVEKDYSESYFYKTKPCKGNYYWNKYNSKKYKGRAYYINYKRPDYKVINKYKTYSNDLEKDFKKQMKNENRRKYTL